MIEQFVAKARIFFFFFVPVVNPYQNKKIVHGTLEIDLLKLGRDERICPPIKKSSRLKSPRSSWSDFQKLQKCWDRKRVSEEKWLSPERGQFSRRARACDLDAEDQPEASRSLPRDRSPPNGEAKRRSIAACRVEGRRDIL